MAKLLLDNFHDTVKEIFVIDRYLSFYGLCESTATMKCEKSTRKVKKLPKIHPLM